MSFLEVGRRMFPFGRKDWYSCGVPKPVEPSLWILIPFAVMLGSLAAGPLWFPRWWAKHYSKVSFFLGAVVAGYYLFGLKVPGPLLEKASEYFSFIVLIGSLFVVSGGIHLQVRSEATPAANVVFLLVGAVLANILGTTGASMLLIRPWLRMNQHRDTRHHVVFFIFIVSNVGGCLTPIGDPPLFLGFILGVPFWWVARNCWPMWVVAISILLVLFYFVDRYHYRRAPEALPQAGGTGLGKWKFRGMHNLFFLGVILAATFLEHPRFLRETLMIAAAAGSYFFTAGSVHQANQFDFHPLREVAVLFAGIFATMIPALDWLAIHAPAAGRLGPAALYFGSGILSSVLDNAPTYLGFLQMLVSGAETGSVSMVVERFPGSLVAISVGSVFFGATTYLGNGPNLMVKSIAERQGVSTPDFFGYIRGFTLPFMVPTLVVVWWIFFRN